MRIPAAPVSSREAFWSWQSMCPLRKQAVYRNAALRILRAIDGQRADWSDGCDAIVQNCSAAYHADRHHFTMTYADYFFIEAVYKLKNIGRLLW